MTPIKTFLLATALTAVAAPAFAQSAPPATAAERDARIDALQAQLNAIAAELQALRAGGAAPATGTTATATTPTSPATASSGTAIAAVGTNPAGVDENGRQRIFGAGVPSSPATSRLDSGGPIIATPDGRFSASLLAVMQFDVADYFQPAAGPLTTDFRRGGAVADTAHARDLQDGTTFRRARFGIAGKAFGDFEYTALFAFDGAGSEDNGHIQELWLQYSGIKPLHFRVGAFRPSIGLEDQGSTNGQPFLERPTSTDIGASFAGGDFREAGQVIANTDRFYASAAITGRLVTTAGAATVQPYRDPLGFIGRVAAIAYRSDDTLVHVGAHGSYVAHPANTAGPDVNGVSASGTIDLRERPELRVDGTRLIDSGAIPAAHAYTVGAEGAIQYRNLLLQGEYEYFGIDRGPSALADPHFSGFYVEGTWVITGQRRRYNTGNFAFDGPAVKRSFNPLAGNWGAWELAARYSSTDLNYDAGAQGSAPAADAVRGGSQHIATAALNWYLNPIMRIMFQYQHVAIDRLSPNAATFLTPVGAFVGQSYDDIAARFQFAF
jgi:phosphate-selective porin OprO/OprP